MNSKIHNIPNEEMIRIPVNSTETTEQGYIFAMSAQSSVRRKIFVGATGEPSFIQSESTDSEFNYLVPISPHEEIEQTLIGFERKYHMSSEEFYQRWLTGDAPHLSDVDTLKWVALWEAWYERFFL